MDRTPRPPRPYAEPPKRRRRFSPWSILAPLALIAVVVMTFNALGKSCVFRDCDPVQKKQATTRADKPAPRRHRVKEGETAQSIADLYGLTIDQLRACNPEIADIYIIRPGELIRVNPKRCDKEPPGV